jgi:hypothetical protein
MVGTAPVDVLISNAWGRSPYNIVRSLARRGLRTVVGTDRLGGMAALSRYPIATFRHPACAIEPDGFVNRIEVVMREYTPRVFVPGGEDAYIVSKHLDRLRSYGADIPVAPYPVIRQLHKKDEVVRLAASLAIPVPETAYARDANGIRDFSETRSRTVLKRISSSSGRGVFYLSAYDSDAQRHDVLKTVESDATGFIMQEYVSGTGYGVAMLFNRGALRAKFTHRRLEENTATGGISTVRVGVVHPRLEEYAERLLRHVGFHGVAMVEFKHNEETGQSWLIEVNPRIWGSLALAIQSGVDFPYLLFRMATEGDVAPVMEYRTGVVVKWLLGHLGATAERLSGRRPPSALTHVRADGYDDWYWDDPLAFFGEAVLTARKLMWTRNWRPEEMSLSLDRLEHGGEHRE